jgi:hypothetical protein
VIFSLNKLDFYEFGLESLVSGGNAFLSKSRYYLDIFTVVELENSCLELKLWSEESSNGRTIMQTYR